MTKEFNNNNNKSNFEVKGKLLVNSIADKLPIGTTIYSSNVECHSVKNDNNYILVDTVSVVNKNDCLKENKNHSVFLGRNVNDETKKGDILSEFGGISSNSDHINGSIKVVAKDDFDCNYSPTKINVEVNNKTVASFQEIANTPNFGTATITLSVYYCEPPCGNFKEGTIALLNKNKCFSLIVYNGKEWVKLT
jgi:hypothetical protein